MIYSKILNSSVGTQTSLSSNPSSFTATGTGFLFLTFMIKTTDVFHVSLYINNSKIGQIRKYLYNSGSTTDCYMLTVPIKKENILKITGLVAEVITVDITTYYYEN